MSVQWIYPQIKLFDAKAATWTTASTLVQDWKSIFLTFSSTGSANFTMKFQVSYQDTAPDFSAAASPTNQWSYVQVLLATTKAAVDWATGISAAGADSTMNYVVNLDWARWFWATITAYAAGALHLRMTAKNNQ